MMKNYSLYDFAVIVRETKYLDVSISLIEFFDDKGYILKGFSHKSYRKWGKMDDNTLFAFISEKSGQYYGILHTDDIYRLYYEKPVELQFKKSEHVIYTSLAYETIGELMEAVDALDNRWINEIYPKDKNYEEGHSYIHAIEFLFGVTVASFCMDMYGMPGMQLSHSYFIWVILSICMVIHAVWMISYENRRMHTYMRSRRIDEHEIKKVLNRKRRITARCFFCWEAIIFLEFTPVYIMTFIITPIAVILLALMLRVEMYMDT